MTERQSHLSETPSTNGETEVFSAPSTGAPSAGEGATRTLPEASRICAHQPPGLARAHKGRLQALPPSPFPAH